jgi:hypothetical protein
LQAEEYESRDIEMEELCALIQRAGRSYTAPIEHAASELELVERLDPFTWAKPSRGDSCHWHRYESAKGFLFQKKALMYLASDKLALAIASYKQALDLWPTLSSCAVMGGLQAACGLVSDAKATFQMCIGRADELGAVESKEDRKQIVSEVRVALNELE